MGEGATNKQVAAALFLSTKTVENALTSVYAKLFEASGIPYEELVDRLIELALERRERRSHLQY